MARIAGVDLPRDKRVEIGLTYILGYWSFFFPADSGEDWRKPGYPRSRFDGRRSTENYVKSSVLIIK